MTVYVEDSIIENFFVTLFLLLCLNQIFGKKQKKVKLILVSLFAGIIATFYPLINFSSYALIIFKLCVGVVIVYLYSGKTKMLAKYITFMLLTSLYAGINLLVYYFVYGSLNIQDNFTSLIIIGILYLTYYFVTSCINLLKKNLVVANFVYNITLKNDGISINDHAFLDSGNTLLDQQDSSPIYIINYKLFNKLYKNITLEDILSKNYKTLINPHYVKSNFASGGAKILVFTIQEMQIFNTNKVLQIKNAKLGLVYSKFSKNFNCNMLLNINAFTNLN